MHACMHDFPMHTYCYHVVMHMPMALMTNIFIDYLTPSKTLYISPYMAMVYCLFNTLHSRQAVPADSLIYID